MGAAIIECCSNPHPRNLRGACFRSSHLMSSSPSLHSSRRFARAQGRILAKNVKMKRTERSMILDANWRLANAKCSMLQENSPDAACCAQQDSKDGERQVALDFTEIGSEDKKKKKGASRVTPAACCVTSGCRFLLIGQSSISSFGLRTQRVVNARRHAGSCLCCRALMGTYLHLLLCARLIALLCCAVAAWQPAKEGKPRHVGAKASK